jgi:hypothetical protein
MYIPGTLTWGAIATGQIAYVAGSFNCSGLMNNGTETGADPTLVMNGTGSKTISNSDNFGSVEINSSTLTVTASTNIEIVRNLRIVAGTLDIGSFTANRVLNGETFSISNGATLKLAGATNFPSNYGTYSLGATSTVDYNGAAQTVSSQSYGHLTLSGSGTKTMPGSSMTLSGNFTMSGTPSATAAQALTVWGDFTIGNGCTFNASSYTHTLKANFSNSGTFTASTSTMTFNGNTAEDIGGSTSTTFNNLTMNDSSGVTLSTNTTVGGTLTFTGGNLTTGSNTLIINSTGSVSRTSGHVVGNFQKYIASGATSKTFEIGTGSNYTPADVTFDNVSVAGNLTASTNAGDHANIGSSTINSSKSVNRTWALTNSAITFSSYSATFTFVAGDVDAGAATNDFIVGRYNAGWTYPTVGTKTATTTQLTGATSFGDFQIGEPESLPIQLSSFTAQFLPGTQRVVLRWTTLSELNNYGFYVERRAPSEQGFTTVPNSFVAGHGTTVVPQYYMFADTLPHSGTWFYRLKQIDLDGTVHYSDPIRIDMPTDVGENEAPAVFSLEQNYPNPFNPSTMIRYSIPKSALVQLRVFDMLGREVAILIDEEKLPGTYSIVWNPGNLATGMYVYRLQSGDFTAVKRLVLVK